MWWGVIWRKTEIKRWRSQRGATRRRGAWSKLASLKSGHYTNLTTPSQHNSREGSSGGD